MLNRKLNFNEAACKAAKLPYSCRIVYGDSYVEFDEKGRVTKNVNLSETVMSASGWELIKVDA